MYRLSYKVIESFDPNKDYGEKITNQVSKCLSSLEKGKVFSPTKFVNEHLSDFVREKKPNFLRTKCIVSESMSIAKKIGIIEEVKTKPMSFDEFLKLETVQYFKNQLRGFEQHHKTSTNQGKIGGTQKLYLYRVWQFSNWLIGREFEYKKIRQIDLDTYKKTTEKVTLEHIEHFLKLFQDSVNADQFFIKIIKTFLMSAYEDHRASTVTITRSAIKAYFTKNDSPISFDYNPKINHHVSSEEELDQCSLSLEDFMKILTVGRPSLMEKAVLLCKFHRGLDNATFADRFNYQAWEQITQWLGTEEYERWDLTKCPVPIKLTRIKTNFTHRGFLDRDAISALQDYLPIRFKITGKTIQKDESIFLNKNKVGITDHLISGMVKKLAKRAGIYSYIQSYELSKRGNKTSHELRDLLKSTLIAFGTADYVCDLVIGHKVGDSYEKQDKLYPEKTRAEFMKASRKINIFSNMSQYLKGHEDSHALRKQVDELKENQEKLTLQLERLEEKQTNPAV